MPNYFELFDLAVHYSIEEADLKKRFFKLSRAVHPDFHIQDSDAAQSDMLEQSSALNKAYTTLKDPELRLDYILALKEIVVPGEKLQLPSAFLMEMMELNETLEEAEESADETRLKVHLEQITQLENAFTAKLTNGLHEINNSAVEATLGAELKLIYYQRKYLLRIKQKLDTFASR